MTFVLSSSHDAIIYVSPRPHPAPAGNAYLTIAEAGSAFRGAYPVERAALAADAIAVSLASAHDRVTAPFAKAAASFVRPEGEGVEGGWSQFGYARLDDHARERFGRCGRSLRDLAALGEAMTRLPQIERALGGDDGDRPLDRTAAVLVARVARADTVDDWIGRARKLTVRELREAIREAREHGGGRDADPVESGESGGRGEPDGTDAIPDVSGGDISDAASPPRRLVKLLVPAATKGIFEEALELFRAVEGCEATVTSFVEALVAEGMTGPEPANWEVESASLTHADSRDAIERAHERSTGNWHLLPRAGRGDWALKLAGACLKQFAALCERAGTGDAIELDLQIRELQRIEDEMERRLADLLATMADQGAWARLRFDGSGHYAEERLRISRTVAADRIRAARGLRRLPVIRRAYEAGEIALEPTLHIIRILRDTLPDVQAQGAWVARAREATVKRMRDEAREIERRRLTHTIDGGHGWSNDAALKSAPLDHAPFNPVPLDDAALKIAPSDHAPFNPVPLDDAAWRASLWRDPGMARARVERLGQLAVANPVPDVFLRLRLADGMATALLGAVESRRRHLALQVEQIPWDQPWPDDKAPASVRVARECFVRCRRTPAWVGLMSLLEEFVQTWDPPPAEVRRRSDAVYARAGWRCCAPGCTSRRNLEDHHLVHRSRGGGDELSNRECLCRFHHQRGEHGGLARCRGRAPLDVTWRLGREMAATWWRNDLKNQSPSVQESPADTGASLRSFP